MQENEDENECRQLCTHGGGATQPPLGEPLNEEGHYRQDPHEQAEHLYNQYRDGLASVHQQQEKREQEIHEYYRRREQQWQNQQVVMNNLPMSGDPTNVWLTELPRVPPAQLLPRARDFQSALTDHEEDINLMGADPQLSMNVRVRTVQSKRLTRQVTYGDHCIADPC